MLARFGSSPLSDMSGAYIEAKRVAHELTVFRRFRRDISDTGSVGERQPLLESAA